MLRFVARRVAATVPVLLLVSLGVFLLIHMIPGDPVDVMLGESQSPEARESLRKELGFDQPLYIQYVDWLGNILHGDLGKSVRTHQSVVDNVAQRLRPSLELATLAMLIALII